VILPAVENTPILLLPKKVEFWMPDVAVGDGPGVAAAQLRVDRGLTAEPAAPAGMRHAVWGRDRLIARV